MQACIIAAGFGTRLRPLTLTTPKLLVPVAGRPLLEYHIAQLKKHGVRRLLVNTHHLSEQIEQYVDERSRFGFSEVFISREFPDILGTAGALKHAEDRLDDEMLVIYGDTFTLANYAALVRRHHELGADVTIAVYTEPNIESKGMVVSDGNFVHEFIEKPKPEQVVSHWANAGLYVLAKSVVTEVVPIGFSDFGHDIFPKLLAAGKSIGLYYMKSDEVLLDVGTHATLALASKFVEDHPQLFSEVYWV